MSDSLHEFSEVWALDFEFTAPTGERPAPVCMVAIEIRTGRTMHVWQDELRRMTRAPFPADSLLIAYYASAEMGCYLALDWPLPPRMLDLFTEFRCLTNGASVPSGNGLLGALTYYGLDCVDAVEKDDMRALAMRGGSYTDDERVALIDYCESDVRALVRLLPAMLPSIDIPRALLRARYMSAVARMEHVGVPIDVQRLDALRVEWGSIKRKLVERVDRQYGVYDGDTFKLNRFEQYLVRYTIPWPRTETGRLATDGDTFRERAKAHPELSALRELRHSLGEMRLFDLAVGRDGRNRCLLSPFRARTGRNQPSNARFIFGPSVWLRGLIKPEEGQALAYVDWSQQEFGIAAALSGDHAMLDAYSSGDPYLAFAKQAGAVPANATKKTHPQVRELFKVCALAVQYGMGPESLAQRLGVPPIVGRHLLEAHRDAYPQFWKWSQAAMDHAVLYGELHTIFGWRIHVDGKSNPRSLANFPVQANGAEMLRLAACLATEKGIRVCAPIHDAFLIEANEDAIQTAVEETQLAMAEASRIVLEGLALRSDVQIVRWPDRYMDERGRTMWESVMALMNPCAA